MAFSVLFIILINTVTYIEVRQLYIQILKDRNFSDSIYNVIFIIVIISTFWVPLLAWFDMKKSVSYITQWMEFNVSERKL